MKISLLNFLVWTGLTLSISNSAIASPETFTFDPSHSFVTWHVNHFGFSNPSGKWNVEGKLVLDEKKPTDSKVNVKINLASLVTGIPKLDEHLKSSDFFDVEKYPVATFVSDKVNVLSKNSATVHGMLTLHGVTKPVTLNVKLLKLAEHPYTHKQSAGFFATTTLKRSDFGINKYIPDVGDEVKIEIDAEAGLEK